MQPVYLGLHCQFLSHVLKVLFFYQNSPKIRLFLQNNAKFSKAKAGGSAPKPPAAGGSASTPLKQPPIANFWLRA